MLPSPVGIESALKIPADEICCIDSLTREHEGTFWGQISRRCVSSPLALLFVPLLWCREDEGVLMAALLLLASQTQGDRWRVVGVFQGGGVLVMKRGEINQKLQ